MKPSQMSSCSPEVLVSLRRSGWAACMKEGWRLPGVAAAMAASIVGVGSKAT
uniref:Uncharacterized protein n=1 Tax=Janibacter limosus TaxID=53458 RepID=A0AC61U2S3_9MICO|nr:hypothetical protein [Janibacter limosus]